VNFEIVNYTSLGPLLPEEYSDSEVFYTIGNDHEYVLRKQTIGVNFEIVNYTSLGPLLPEEYSDPKQS